MTPIRKMQCLAGTSLLMVFTIDILTPPQYVFDVLYLCCIVIVYKQSVKTIAGFSFLACLLIVISLVLSGFKHDLTLLLWVNRGISILAILIATYLAIHYRKLNQAVLLQMQRHSEALEKMLFITSHEVRKPVANILGLIDDINSDVFTHDLDKQCRYLKVSATELDAFIKKLNAFIEHAELQNHTQFDTTLQ